MSSIQNLDDRPDVLEDVDGIGKLTSDSTTDPVTEASSPTQNLQEDATAESEDIIPSIDESQLIDPSSVVEQIIGVVADETLDDSLENKTIDTSEQAIETPNLKQIFNFAIPAIGVWLCSPILSLIDTSSVGLLSGTMQQAALNPAVAVTEYSALLVAFMYTGTTNLVARAKESEASGDDTFRSDKALVKSMQLSVYVGTIVGAMLMIFSRSMLKAIIGNDNIDVEVFAAAMRYVRIRALGMPAAVVIGSTQSACIGLKDVRSPLYVLLAAAVVNFFGDVLFVPRAGAWLGGASGAAWATVFSQYAALVMFIRWLTGKTSKERSDAVTKVNVTDAILELTGKSEAGKSRRTRLRNSLRNFRSHVTKSTSKLDNSGVSVDVDESEAKQTFSSRGLLAGKFSFKKLVQFPAKKDIKLFSPFFLPVTTSQFGRLSSYVTMSHVVASSFGTCGMAAHQIIMSFFFSLCPIADSLNLTAQSFIPGIYGKKISSARSYALKTSRNNFLKAGLIFGAIMTSFVGALPLLGKFFTSDASVIAAVNSAVPALAGFFILHGVTAVSEGMILGQKDLGYLGKLYAFFFFAVPYFMLRVKRGALAGVESVGLRSLWNIFFLYQCTRTFAHLLRISQLQRRAENMVKP